MALQAQAPQHIAIVMDGNGRWAKRRNLPASIGHKNGVETVRRVLEACETQKVQALTLFAFSSENWKRPALEVKALMALFSSYLDNEVQDLHQRGVCLRFIGRRDRFDSALLKKITAAEALTAHNARFYLNLAVDYGGQWDIVQAAKKLALQVAQGQLLVDDITPDTFQPHLCLADLPAVDLLIRSSGEYRLSNFMLWQIAYAELYFTDVLWPDFDSEHLRLAIESYHARDRRFGARPSEK